MKNFVVIIVGFILLTGCETYTASISDMQRQVQNSANAGANVSLGDSKTEVLNRLLSAQSYLDPMFDRRPPDQHMKDGKKVFIHYQRTGWVSDGRSTDDEFTPYIFENDKLVAIGWSTIGGPKVVSSGASSGMGGTVTINDPVRDSNALIQRGQRMMSGACTLGVNC